MSSSLLSLAEDTFCLRLQRAARMWRKVADIELKKLNLSEATSTPLWLIYKMGEGLRQRTLAEHLGLEGHSLVRLLDQLEEAGLVVRRDDALDRRAKTLYLTDAGRQVGEQVDTMVKHIKNKLLHGVGADQLALVDSVLNTIATSAEK
ncbi:MAG: MarR family transcriptional regulator [Pseudomonadota bacterium]|jgi:MarR family transcriptional regulator for hemolysin|uniref:MarR family transcriptional regulator n=1 Tax=Burkholderiaceae TaxID=119060 RepID=UPI00201730C9|nr:MarR family transcriptional regulator [Burkholderia sp. 4M9327F10]